MSDIAVVGMACVFPGAPSLARYWHNLCHGIDAIGPVPASRLDPVFSALGAARIDRYACTRGGFIAEDTYFDPHAHGMMPLAVDVAEPEQLLTLEVAARALRDAGYDRGKKTPENTAILLGRGNYASSARNRFEQAVRGAQQVVSVLRDLFPQLPDTELERVRTEFQARVGAPQREAVVNLVPNLVASRIAERFHFHGPAYTIDAACASSLVALDQARMLLQTEQADMALAGGVHLAHTEDFWCVFNQLGLLSPQGMSRPLDRRADGLLISEGVGVVVLKRVADARRDGDRVYALLAGTGTASDGRGTSVVRPNQRGQTLALERAWQRSGRDPAELELLEAHATGTQAGDAVELETVAGFFGPTVRERATIGSVKSMIGHPMPAAGIAGFIKATLAVHHGVLLPTLHCEQPRAELEPTRFSTRPLAQPWQRDVRIAGVNAFGFGGINAHAIVVSAQARGTQPRAPLHTRLTPKLPEVARYAGASVEALLEAVAQDRRGAAGRVRAAIIEPTPERRALAARVLQTGRSQHGRRGIFFSSQSLLEQGGRVAFVFPGFDAGAWPKADELAAWLGESVPAEEAEHGLEARGRAIIALNARVLRGLARMGIVASACAGHSIGEWSAMAASGVADAGELARLAATLAPGSVGSAQAVFVSAGCSAERLAALLGTRSDAVLSHDNCRHQSLLACDGDAAAEIVRMLAEHGVLAQLLPFGSGVHSRFFAPHLQAHLARMRDLPLHAAHTPIYSATTAGLYPNEPLAMRDVIVRHMLEPVRFRETIERMYADGVRVFVQVGTGPLTSFIADILHDRPHVAVSAHGRERADLEQLAHAACAVWVEGGDVSWAQTANEAESDDRPASARTLRLSAPLISLRGLSLQTTDGAPASSLLATAASTSSGVAALLQENFRRMAEVQSELSAAASARTRSTVARELSVRTHPELLDHAFYRQPPGWTDLGDLMPVVPMTGLLELLTLGVGELSPQHVIAIHDVWAKRWLDVSEAKHVSINSELRSDGRVAATIDGYAEATLQLGELPATPPKLQPFSLQGSRACPMTAEQLYAEHWMFHGRAYHRVRAITELADDGISGEIDGAPALGSLLDAAGQLLGLWLMLTQSEDRFALPVKIGRLRYFQAPPRHGQRCLCSVRITHCDATRVVGDIRIGDEHGLWLEIEAWEDRRFSTDDKLLQLTRWPERTLLSDVSMAGASLSRNRARSVSAYEMLLGRYLARSEREQLAKLDPRQRWDELLTRIAVKDAVRAVLANRASGARFPVELATHALDASTYRVVVGAESWRVVVASTRDEIRAQLEPAKPRAPTQERSHDAHVTQH